MESGKSKSLTRVGTSERCGNNGFLYKKKEPGKIRKQNPLLRRVRDLAKDDMEKDVLPTFLL